MKGWYLVSYDIKDETRLRKVGRVMLGYGSRLQYSVFRCRLSGRDIERMRWELAKVIQREDELLVASLCDACVKKLTVHSSTTSWPAEGPRYEIL